jgi:uncharacterized protein (TIGR02452 family)
MGALAVLPCWDGDDQAEARRRELSLSREAAAGLGRSALQASRQGWYMTTLGERVDIRRAVEAATTSRLSIPPEATLPGPTQRDLITHVQVANETTMGAARRLVDAGHKTVALNFANGFQPGGGFLDGARAQEEVLCRSSALFVTLDGDAMYEAHRRWGGSASSDWAILSPDVPFFRLDDGVALDRPWPLSVLTCAAPVAMRVGSAASALLSARIHRVLAICRAHDFEALVLGAWGCGAFGNDPASTAAHFRDALAGPFLGAFRKVVFAIADWSPERRFLGPFRDTFAVLG